MESSNFQNLNFIEAGINRNFGWARIQFESIQQSTIKPHDPKINWLKKINTAEFTSETIQKAIRLIPHQIKFDESLYWLILFLVQAEENGHICIEKEKLFELIINKNSLLDPNTSIKKKLEEFESGLLTNQLPFLCDLNCFYLIHLYNAEVRLSMDIKSFYIDHPSIEAKFSNTKLSEEQKVVINKTFERGLTFISGGPGSGKTTIIEYIVREAINRKISPEKIILATPTGKAAKRLKESAKDLFMEYSNLPLPATIHKILEYSVNQKSFRKNEDNPLDVDMVIVDEASMLDIFLISALFKALIPTKNIRIIFVGDPDQLLSVEAGSIFSDLVNSGNQSLKLTKSFRVTSLNKDLTKLAESIRNEKLFEIPTMDDSDIDFMQNEICFIKSDTLDETDLFMKLFKWRNFYSKQEKETYQIISPFNEGTGSVSKINELFHQNYIKTNPPDSKDFREPVIVKHNLYNLDIYNGETGYLIFEDKNWIFQTSDLINYVIPNGLIDSFEKAYAITIHKSQGSEYDHVCLVIPEIEDMKNSILNKRILYTAITRAKKTLTIIGSKNTFEQILNNSSENRRSNLIRRIIQS